MYECVRGGTFPMSWRKLFSWTLPELEHMYSLFFRLLVKHIVIKKLNPTYTDGARHQATFALSPG